MVMHVWNVLTMNISFTFLSVSPLQNMHLVQSVMVHCPLDTLDVPTKPDSVVDGWQLAACIANFLFQSFLPSNLIAIAH